MAQSKKIEITWQAIVVLIIAGGIAVYFGVRTHRLSKQDEAHIAVQAILESQRDSSYAKAVKLAEENRILKAKADSANKNTEVYQLSLSVYKKRYEELKNKPEVHDTLIVQECDELLVRYDNFIVILKANVLSYSRLADTLQLENKYLKEAYGISLTLNNDQKRELEKLRGRNRVSKILNWSLGGVLTGAIAILFIQ